MDRSLSARIVAACTLVFLLSAAITQVDWNTQIKNKPWAARTSVDFDFHQSPGGTLTAGQVASVALSPCPTGVGSYSVGQSVYISGGTGTAEATPINGFTANGSGCLLSITSANNHSGGWSIGSATGGVQEMANAAVPNASIVIGAGVTNLYAPVKVTKNGLHWRCEAAGVSSPCNVQIAGSNSQVAFDIEGGAGYLMNVFEDIQITTAFGNGNTNIGVKCVAEVFNRFHRMTFNNVWHAFDFDRCGYTTVEDTYTIGQSDAKFFDSTSAAGTPQIIIRNWLAYGALSWSVEPVIYLQYGPSSVIEGVTAVLDGSRDGIQLATPGNEAVVLRRNGFLMPRVGITTKGMNFSQMVENNIDAPTTGCYLIDGSYQNSIQNNICTNALGAPMAYCLRFVNTGAVEGSNTIIGNVFSGVKAGNALDFVSSPSSTVISSNSFVNYSFGGVARGISIPAGMYGFTIVGNTFGAWPVPIGNISSISNANPALVTLSSAANGLATGGVVYFLGGTGNWAALNSPNSFTITYIDTTHFNISANTTTFGSYSGQTMYWDPKVYDIVDNSAVTVQKQIVGNSSASDTPFHSVVGGGALGTGGLGLISLGPALLAALPTAPNGSIAHCLDCKTVADDGATAAATCVGGGHGTIARRENSAWRCN